MPSQLSALLNISRMPQRGLHFGAVTLCLISLLLQIALPIAHNILEHPSLLSSRDGCFPACNSSVSGPVLSFGKHTISHHHDPGACPICQALTLSHSFWISKIAAGPISQGSGEMLIPSYDGIRISTLFSFSFSPRSPPHFA